LMHRQMSSSHAASSSSGSNSSGACSSSLSSSSRKKDYKFRACRQSQSLGHGNVINLHECVEDDTELLKKGNFHRALTMGWRICPDTTDRIYVFAGTTKESGPDQMRSCRVDYNVTVEIKCQEMKQFVYLEAEHVMEDLWKKKDGSNAGGRRFLQRQNDLYTWVMYAHCCGSN